MEVRLVMEAIKNNSIKCLTINGVLCVALMAHEKIKKKYH